MPKLSNKTYDEINIGDSASYSKTLTEEDVLLFASTSGDINPVHLNEEFAKGTPFGGRIAHGMWSASLVSAAIATELPGPGSIYVGQSLKFKRPVFINDTLTVELKIIEKIDKRQRVLISCKVLNQNGALILTGEADVMAPSEKLSLERPKLPIFTQT
ncbi:MAG: MaoC family dehydratase N-terminal domain-containing protein [Gammaproteobacteria bacterium]|nr:MaoC family dehydratase N-terminal domain-containing protein [Gammaproteobacteria bacterium]